VSALYVAAMVALLAAPVAACARARLAAGVAAGGCAGLIAVGIVAALGHARPVVELGDWLGFGTSALRADGLAGIFLALTGVTGLAVSLALLETPAGRWPAGLHAVLLLAVAIVIGSDNGFLLFLGWEALTLCVYLIASSDRERPGALAAGYVAGGLTKLGGGALLAALALLYGHTGSFSLADWTHAALGSGTRSIVFLLMLVAFATKIGVLPLQGALPAGYGAAPRAGAASLSVALCAGYYGLWRFAAETLAPPPAWWGELLLVLGSLTAIAGILYALTQDDIRRFLGFSTIEHAGITLVGFGVALLGQAAGNRTLAAAGLLAATLHVVAHGCAKTLALLATDRLELATGERGLDRLGGVGRGLPSVGVSLGVASLTLAAVPPLGGFVSEWFTFEALLQGFRLPGLASRVLCALAAAALALTAGLGLLAFAKLLGFSVLGARRGAAMIMARPGGALALVPLAVVTVLIGALAPWEIHLLGAGLSGVLGFDPAGQTISHPLVLGPVFEDFSVLAPTWLALVLPALATLAAALASARGSRSPRRAPVWVTGSATELATVQYRPSSYVNPIRVVLRGVLGYRRELRSADGALLLETRIVLAIERFVYTPVANATLRLAAGVRRLQSGSLGAYLLYMLAVLIVILALIPALH
jgi:hydrogenase-4 component B